MPDFKQKDGSKGARMFGKLRTVWLAIWLIALSSFAFGEEFSREQMKGLDEQVQEIKADVLGIAVELNQLEEKLLYPSDTQLAIFVSLAESEKFRLDSVEIRLGGQPVANHLYTFKELDALQHGGVQRIYTGNVTTGKHDLQVTLTGKSGGGAEVRNTENFAVAKGVGPKIVEITLAENALQFRDW
jgi:hypothetical protein